MLGLKSKSNIVSAKAFTLIEIVIVIVIFGLIASLLLRTKLGSYQYWEQEGAIRKISEHINFLYYQAITDGKTYRMEFNLSENSSYRIGELVEEKVEFEEAVKNVETGSLISQEIDNYIHPAYSPHDGMVPPQDIPSLRDPIALPGGMRIVEVKTVRGVHTTSFEEDKPYIIFSPRGFSDFAVIHLELERSETAEVTILINPFTGLTTVYREYKDFEWNYGRDEK